MDLLRSDEYWDPHAVAGLLKYFFRDLPSSILTRELHMRFLSVMGTFHIRHIASVSRRADRIVHTLRPGRFPGKDHRALAPYCGPTSRKLQPSPCFNRTPYLDCTERQR
jgi:hypothetical protein